MAEEKIKNEEKESFNIEKQNNINILPNQEKNINNEEKNNNYLRNDIIPNEIKIN